MKKTIIFSLLCHENLECIKDLILNIKNTTKDFNISILIISKNFINNLFNEYNYDSSVRIIDVRDDKNIWGTIDIFYYHMIWYTISGWNVYLVHLSIISFAVGIVYYYDKNVNFYKLIYSIL